MKLVVNRNAHTYTSVFDRFLAIITNLFHGTFSRTMHGSRDVRSSEVLLYIGYKLYL